MLWRVAAVGPASSVAPSTFLHFSRFEQLLFPPAQAFPSICHCISPDAASVHGDVQLASPRLPSCESNGVNKQRIDRMRRSPRRSFLVEGFQIFLDLVTNGAFFTGCLQVLLFYLSSYCSLSCSERSHSHPNKPPFYVSYSVSNADSFLLLLDSHSASPLSWSRSPFLLPIAFFISFRPYADLAQLPPSRFPHRIPGQEPHIINTPFAARRFAFLTLQLEFEKDPISSNSSRSGYGSFGQHPL